MHQRNLGGDQAKERIPARPLRFQARADARPVQPTRDPDDDRRAHGTEGHRGRLDHHPDHDRGQRGKSERHQQRSRHGRRGAETRSTLDEAAEQPRDDDRLHPAIRTDPRKPAADGGDRPRMLERVEQQDRAEDDPQDRTGQHQPLERGCDHPIERHLPRSQGDRGRTDEYRRHRAACGPVETDQQHRRQDQRDKRKQGQHGLAHGSEPPGLEQAMRQENAFNATPIPRRAARSEPSCSVLEINAVLRPPRPRTVGQPPKPTPPQALPPAAAPDRPRPPAGRAGTGTCAGCA